MKVTDIVANALGTPLTATQSVDVANVARHRPFTNDP